MLTEISDSGIFLPALLRWLDIMGTVLFVGSASFREMTYLPGILAIKDKKIREQMFTREDALANKRFTRILYFLATLLFTGLIYRLFAMKAGASPDFNKFTFWVILGAKSFVIALLLLLVRSRVDWKGPALFGLSTLLCLTGSLSGHAFASGTLYLVLTDWLHFTAVSVWAGGLLPLRNISRRSREHLETMNRSAFLARLIEVFSFWAILCVGTIIMTGSFKAMIYLDPVSDILTVIYGKVFFTKLTVVSIAIGLGGVSRFYIFPRLKNVQASIPAALGRLEKQLYGVLTVELGFVVLVLIFAALLTQTPTP